MTGKITNYYEVESVEDFSDDLMDYFQDKYKDIYIYSGVLEKLKDLDDDDFIFIEKEISPPPVKIKSIMLVDEKLIEECFKEYDKNKGEKEPRMRKIGGKTYFRDRVDAEVRRKYGERVYYDDKKKGYYLWRPDFEVGTGTGHTFGDKYDVINEIKYYHYRKDAEKKRGRGDRIFHTPGLGYYIYKPSKNGFQKRSKWG